MSIPLNTLSKVIDDINKLIAYATAIPAHMLGVKMEMLSYFKDEEGTLFAMQEDGLHKLNGIGEWEHVWAPDSPLSEYENIVLEPPQHYEPMCELQAGEELAPGTYEATIGEAVETDKGLRVTLELSNGMFFDMKLEMPK